jgi:hypothetical protein
MRYLLCPAILLVLAGGLLAQNEKYNQFVSQLAKALEYDDGKTLDKALREASAEAVRHFDAITWTWRAAQDERNRKSMDFMKASWARVFPGSDTLDRLERYITSIDTSMQKTLVQADSSLHKVWGLYNEAQKEKTREAFVGARQGATDLARSFEQLGHNLQAAECWSLAQQISNNIPEKSLEDRREALFAAQQFIAQRQSWKFTEDTLYKQFVVWLKAEESIVREAEAQVQKRADAGYNPDVKGAEALVMPNAVETVVDLQFAPMDKLHPSTFARAGATPALWLATQVQKTGPTQMGWFKACDLYMVREGSSKYGVTLDGGEADLSKNRWQPVETSAKFRASTFYIDADHKRQYTMWFYTAGEDETLFGMNHNLAPQPEFATVYYRSAASWSATINDTGVVFFDDNCNGKLFEDDPYAYGLVDRALGNPDNEERVAAYDSMQIGSEPAVPWSSFAKIGDKWFHLRGKGDLAIGARPLNPEFFKAGQIQLEWQGNRKLKPEVLIVRGLEEPFVTAAFDISSGKAVDVPVGSYEIAFGRIASGKGAQALEAHVFKGKMEPIKVAAGAATGVKMGAPFVIDFERGGGDEEVVIDAMRLRVLGAGGELYARINGDSPAPEVLYSKTDNGRGAKPIGTFVRMTQDVLEKVVPRFPKMGIEVGFFPVVKGSQEGETKLTAKLPGKGFVGLRQKKHKLFGKLDPLFK